MSVPVLDQMQVLDKEVAPERPISEQGAHLCERRGINLAALRGAARPPLATGRVSVHHLHLFQLNTLTRSYQNSPTIRPSAPTSIESAAGTLGSPGMVMISPQIATTNSAPAESRTSRTVTVWPSGAPLTSGLVEKLYWVLAMQIGRLP